MIDLAMTTSVVVALALVLAALSSKYPRKLRPWLWLALAEYLMCAVAEYYFAVDASLYREEGNELAKMLETSFSWASHELLLLLFQQPSAFDRFVLGAGTNTGSMSAAIAWITFGVRGSPYAAQALVAGLSMLGALATFNAIRHEAPTASPVHLFAAIVLFPSVAFWTSALHKEAFCLMGTGLLLSGWIGMRRHPIRAVLFLGLGAILIALFRAPVLPPLLLGLAIHFVLKRTQRLGSSEMALVAPMYVVVVTILMGFGMLLISRVSPSLALENLADSVADHQRAWSMAEGGSSFDVDAPVAQSFGAQVASAPLALLNTLLRPQLFDVTNPMVFASAIEMTLITWFIFRAVRLHGLSGLMRRVLSSPLLAMCAVVTLVGCTFVGLTTRNLGSMARYRVPFLPFYGALLAILTKTSVTASVPSTAGRRRAPPLEGHSKQRIRAGRSFIA